MNETQQSKSNPKNTAVQTESTENVKKEYLLFGKPIEWYQPLYIPPYPHGISKIFTRKQREESNNFFLQYSNTENAPSDCWADISLWAELTYPNCIDSWRMGIMTRFFQCQFWLDDQSESLWGDMRRNSIKAKSIYGQLVEVLDKLCGAPNIFMTEWKPYIVGHYICLDAVFSTFSEQQKRRCAEGIKLYCSGNMEECLVYDGSVVIQNAEDIFEQRIANIGIGHCSQLIEFTANIELTDEEFYNPLLRRLVKMGTMSVVLINDLVSFRKEVIECEADFSKCRNLIALRMLFHNMSLQESVDKLVENLRETDDQVLALVKALKSERPISKNMVTFIDEFLWLVGGNWLFSIGLKRYHGNSLKGFIPLSGKFIFDSKKTIIIPDYDINEKYTYLNEIFNVLN